MRVGYARVSTQDQSLDLQTDALKKAGCTTIFKEKASGKNMERVEFKKLLLHVKKGDELVVWKLDRLGRSLKDLIEQVTKFKEMGVSFISLHDHIDTATVTGQFVFHLFAALAEFERNLIRERTNAGLSAARARGIKGGRPKGYNKAQISKAKAVKMLYDLKDKKMIDIATDLAISESTAWRYLRYMKNT
jgi:DNA invertase Pin-like site-specific DNA recombinase